MIALRFTRHLLLVLASISALLLGACHDDGLITPPDDNTNDSCCASLAVSVTNSRTVAPLAGVSVTLRKGDDVVAVKETDSNGIATFTNVCNAEFNVRLTKTGYSVAELGGIAIERCIEKAVTIGMMPSGTIDPNDSCCASILRIIPTGPDGGTIVGASVRITGANGVARTLVSTADGAVFREVCRGLYGIRISRDGFKVSESSVEIACNVERTERRMLTRIESTDSCCSARLVINVVDQSMGVIVSGATVKLWQGGRLVRTGVVNGYGVVFEQLCEGPYGISVSKDGYTSKEKEIVVHCNAINADTIRLSRITGGDCCNNLATIRLLDSESRQPVGNATVRLYKGGVVLETARATADGIARFDGLCVGEYAGVAERDGYRNVEFHFNIVCGQNAEMTVVMSRVAPPPPPPDSCCNAVIRLRVYEAGNGTTNGTPVAGAQVVIKQGDRTIATGLTDREGNFSRGELCGYRGYVVIIEKDGFVRLANEVSIRDCRTYDVSMRLVRE